MAERLFDVNIDRPEDILAIREKAMSMLKEGKTVMEWENEGTSAKKAFGLPLDKILAETKAYLQAKDPDVYGRRITRTSARVYSA